MTAFQKISIAAVAISAAVICAGAEFYGECKVNTTRLTSVDNAHLRGLIIGFLTASEIISFPDHFPKVNLAVSADEPDGTWKWINAQISQTRQSDAPHQYKYYDPVERYIVKWDNGEIAVLCRDKFMTSYDETIEFLERSGYEELTTQGAQATVLLGTASGTKHVLKVFKDPLVYKKEFSIYDTLRERESPFILQLTSNNEKASWLVLEHADHGDLLNYKETVLTDSQKLHIVKQILEGVRGMHRENIAHRDLKLDNILLKTNSAGELEARIADFGVAENLNDELKKLEFAGTPAYISPEIWSANPEMSWTPDDKGCSNEDVADKLKMSDAYALGVSLLYLFYSNGPKFFEKNTFESIHAVSTATFAYKGNPEAKTLSGRAKLIFGDKYESEPPNDHVDHLITRLLDPEYTTRLKVEDAFSHPCFAVSLSDAELMAAKYPWPEIFVWESRSHGGWKGWIICSTEELQHQSPKVKKYINDQMKAQTLFQRCKGNGGRVYVLLQNGSVIKKKRNHIDYTTRPRGS